MLQRGYSNRSHIDAVWRMITTSATMKGYHYGAMIATILLFLLLQCVANEVKDTHVKDDNYNSHAASDFYGT